MLRPEQRKRLAAMTLALVAAVKSTRIVTEEINKKDLIQTIWKSLI
jgi:hypothetical protein